MPIQKNLNVNPYFDDFDSNKNFHKVLYKPGYPVQARELQQSQTIIQDQIEMLASRLLNEGDNVVPGEFSYRPRVSYVRLSSFTRGTNLSDFVGYNVVGVSSGVTAKVIHTEDATDTEDATLYVSYNSGGTSATETTFTEGEVLESDNPNNITAVVGLNGVSLPVASNALGNGTLFSVTEGAYFVNGNIVRNEAETIALDKYGITPDYTVGFQVNEEIVTSNDDSSLLDNSQGSTNFAAPGADRLKITLSLAKLTPGTEDSNFVRLATIQQGEILGKRGDIVKWDWLYDILARRTYDESGNYIVNGFDIQPMEYYNDDVVDGVFNFDEDLDGYLIADGGVGTSYTQEQAEERFAVKISEGKAYVQGYEVDYAATTYEYNPKARGVSYRNDNLTAIGEGYNLNITNIHGLPDLQNIVGDGNAVAFDDITMYRNFIDGFVGESIDGAGRPLNIGNEPWNTYHIICDGDIGIQSTGYTEIYKEGNTAVITTPNNIQRGSVVGLSNVLIAEKILPTPTGILRPRYVLPEGQVDQGDGRYGFESTYKMGIMTSEFFTELSVIGVTNGSTDWTVGEVATGELSGAYGVIETGSNTETLILSNVVGEFIPGEEMTQGTKVSRILRRGEVDGFRFTDKGTSGTTLDLSSETAINVSAVGSTTQLTVVDGEITVSAGEITITESGRTKLASFPYPNESELNEGIDYQISTVPSAVSGYSVSRTPVTENAFGATKSMFSALADTNDFSADISARATGDAEILAIANGSLFTGVAGTNSLTCDNFSGDASSNISKGELVTFVDDAGTSINRIVSHVTKPIGYGTTKSKSTIYFTTSFPDNVTGKSVQRIRVKTKGSVVDNLIFPLPETVIKSLETDSVNTGIDYQVLREFILNVPSGASTITLTTNRTNETFVANASKTVIYCIENIGDPTDSNQLTGRGLTTSSIDVTQDNGRKVVLNLRLALPSSAKVKVFIPVFVTNAKAKRKIFRTNQSAQVTVVDGRLISLGRADVHEVKSVTDSSGVDVLQNYIFDNGQRDNAYEISRLVLRPGRPEATGTLNVVFDFFEHSDDGDFFTVDSYTDDDGIGFTGVPTFKPSFDVTGGTTVNNDYKGEIQLRDAIDFRPIINFSGPNASVLATITSGVDAQAAGNFRDSSNGGVGFAPRLPLVDSTFRCDIEYYQGRIDSLFLSANGDLTLSQGIYSDSPTPVGDKVNSIRLYDLEIPAYTFSAKDIITTKFNYNRYTMSDIASLDNRITRVEDVMTLSLLEQSAINFDVRDAVTGLNRFKNGVVVDNFSGHINGNVTSDQYRCGVDPIQTHLRCPQYQDQVELEESNLTDEERTAAGYRIHEPGIVTLDYADGDFISQPFATRTINLQPYMVFAHQGELRLSPSIDTWTDTNRQPDLVIQDDNMFRAINTVVGNMGPISTITGPWRTTSVNTNSNRNGRTTTTTTTVNQSRNTTNTFLTVSGSTNVRTSHGNRVTNVALSETMRTIAVRFRATDLKPKTRYFLFFDEVDISSWVSTDSIQSGFDDGLDRYIGRPNEFRGGFGQNIISDDTGTVQGVFLIPNGRPPVSGTQFSDLRNVQYQTSGATRSFNTGTRQVRITSDSQNRDDIDLLEGFADTTFVSSGVIQDVQETIVSTRVPTFGRRQTSSIESRSNTSTNTTTEVVNTVVVERTPFSQRRNTGSRPRGIDPVAQTFMVDSANAEGVFITEIEVFFQKKDEVDGCQVYLTDTDGQVPTENIIPHGFARKPANSTIRVQCDLSGSTESIVAGTRLIGQTSGATGIVGFTATFEDVATNVTKNVSNHVYDVILSNYVNEFIPGEVIVPDVSPASSSTFTIVENEYLIDRIDLKTLGTGYTTASVSFSSPQLPGGVTATGTAEVKDGKVFKVTLTNPGSGYVDVPTATITGDGSGATISVRVVDGNPSVIMGVATSDDATSGTKFRFPAPVYLLGNTWYSFVVKSPKSLEYMMYTSKIGENSIGTTNRVTTQHSMGSMFKSQNGGLWTEDQTTDVKFNMKRAVFRTDVSGTLNLQNTPIDTQNLGVDPIETNSQGVDTDSDIFGDNPKVVKVYHHMHGFVAGDVVYLDGITSDIGGIPFAELNTLHTVLAADFQTYTIKVSTSATSSTKAGGSDVIGTYNRPFEESHVVSGFMQFADTTIISRINTTQSAGITGSNQTNAYLKDSSVNFDLDEYFYHGGPKQIANYLNEAAQSDKLNGGKSLTSSITISTTDNHVSPVIDVERTNITTVRNLIDKPNGTEVQYGALVRTISFGGSITAAGLNIGDTIEFNNGGSNMTVTVREVNNDTSKVKVTGQYANQLAVTSTFTDATLQAAGVTTITDGIGDKFIPETNYNGSTFAKWVSNLFLFEDPCDGIEMKLSAVFYETDSIKVYYKPRNVGFEGELTNVNWIPFNGTGLADDIEKVEARSASSVDPNNIVKSDFRELTYSIQDAPKFEGLELKIVMTADNPAQCPLIDDFRLIATE